MHPTACPFLGAGLILLSLTGCQWIQPPPNHLPWARYVQIIDDHTSWTARGKIRIRDRQQQQSGGFQWQQQGKRFTLSLLRPLGEPALILEQRPQQATLLLEKRKFHGHSAQKLLNRYTHYPLPLDAFPYWIKGMPDPRTSYRIQHTPERRAQRILQRGWQIDYQRYHHQPPHWPRTIQLQQPKTGVDLKVVVTQWTIDD